MGWNTKIPLEPRGDDEPKFNPRNKTDRKIFLIVLFSVLALTLIATGLFVIYYVFFH